MSRRLQVRDLQESRIAPSLNVCSTDVRFIQWLNEAEEQLLNQGRWWGSVQEAQWCVEDGCMTFPRQVATVEQIAVCGQPIQIENGWFGYLRQIANLAQCGDCQTAAGNTCACGHLQLRMKEGTACSFSTTRGVNKTLRVYPTSASDVGKKITFQGYDSNGIWVRKVVDGAIGDGEQVTLAIPYVDTVTVWGPGTPLAVAREETHQRVLVYEHDTDLDTDRQIAIYEPTETTPTYRVGYLPGLSRVRCSPCTSDACERKTVTALVSLQHVPLQSPQDWLIFQNLPAYKAAMMAVKAWEEGDIARGDFYFYGTQASPKNGRGILRVVNRGGAIPLLQAELRKQTSDRTSAMIYTDETMRFTREMWAFK